MLLTRCNKTVLIDTPEILLFISGYSIYGGLTEGKLPEPGQKHESYMKQALWGLQHHSESQVQSWDKEGHTVCHSISWTWHLQCILAANLFDQQWYQGSSSSACSGGNSLVWPVPCFPGSACFANLGCELDCLYLLGPVYCLFSVGRLKRLPVRVQSFEGLPGFLVASLSCCHGTLWS